MTLIVAGVSNEIAYLIADTLISSPVPLKDEAGPVNGKVHALKVQILSPRVAVGFAGDPKLAIQAISRLQTALKGHSNIQIAERLRSEYLALQANQNLQTNACEFLVLQLSQNGNLLWKVNDSGVAHCQRAYIGDSSQYQRLKNLQKPNTFQPQRIPNGIDTPEEIEFDEIAIAMETVCAQTEERQTRTVGSLPDGVTRVVNTRLSGELEYLQTGSVGITPWEGQTGFSVLASNTGTRGIGVYYKSGAIGFLFVVGDERTCHRVEAETLQQFILRAKSEHGLTLTGATWQD